MDDEAARRAFREKYKRIARAEHLMAKAVKPGATARHEAAHAVVAVHGGIRCIKLMLHEGGGGSARLETLPDMLDRKPGTDAKRQARWRAIASLAGGCVEGSHSSPGDRANARATLRSVGLDYYDQIDELRTQAKRMVAKYRRQINRVAAALEGARELSEADVTALIELRSGD